MAPGAVNQGYLAENVRRAAGAHLVTLDGLAKYIGLSRPAIMKMTAHRSEGRSLPSSGTIIRLAEAFGVDARDLVSEPSECLSAIAEAFDAAPIREAADAPEATIPFTRKITTSSLRRLEDAGFPTTSIPRKRRTTKGGTSKPEAT